MALQAAYSRRACCPTAVGCKSIITVRGGKKQASENPRVHAAPVEGQPVAGMIRRGRQTDQELCFGGRRHEQLHDALADDRVLAEQGRELAREPFRTGRSMIFSSIRKGVDELAYGLGDLV